MATLFQELSFLKNMSRNLPIPAFGSAHTFSAYRFSEDCRITFDGTFWYPRTSIANSCL